VFEFVPQEEVKMSEEASPKRPRVVDFSTHWPGALAVKHLVQLGADVIKVENPRTGDGNRTAPFVGERSVFHEFLSAGTRSVALDARSALWAPTVRELAKWADVVIVGNRPSSAAKMGIDFPSLLQINDELVYCLITGYGLDGPLAATPAHGLQPDAAAGALTPESVTLHGDHLAPPRTYRSVGNPLSGIEAALGIFAGLYRSKLGLGGQIVHVSLWESALFWMFRDIVNFANVGESWRTYEDRGPRYCTYEAADDKIMIVCPIEKHFWERFCDVVGLPESTKSRGNWELNGADHGRDYPEEYKEIGAKLRLRPRAEWEALFAERDIPFVSILDLGEVLASPQVDANGSVVDLEHDGQRMLLTTVPVSVTSYGDLKTKDIAELANAHRQKGRSLSPAPALGQDTVEIAKYFHLDDRVGEESS
jgi:crotonobetainyl-CoA:carnitine CoA-transferase CaiB-like acyl-CoA transferase